MRVLYERVAGIADVTTFVSDVRATSDEAAKKIDPRSAERLIRAVYTDEEISDIDQETKRVLYVLLLPALIGDGQLDDTGLNEFLAEARKLADQWLG
jgi:hypothetical protein